MPGKNYTVYWTKAAREDLTGIIEYITCDNIDNAHKIYTRIKNHTEKLEKFPFRGRTVPELQYHNIENYHEVILTPWRIIYRVGEDRVYILAVFDGRRNIEDVLLKRIIDG